MSLAPQVADGFEQYANVASTSLAQASPSLWTLLNTALNVGTTYGRFGGVGAGRIGSVSTMKMMLPSAVAIPGVAMGVQPFQRSAATQVILVAWTDNTDAIQCYLRLNLDGSIEALTGAPALTGGTSLGVSAAGALSSSRYDHMEAQPNIHPSAGTVDVWVNGLNVLALTGKNTRGTSAVSSASFVRLGYQTLADGGAYVDDFVAYDATSRTGASGSFEHYGDKRVQTLLPSGAGTGDVGTFTQVGGTGGSPWTAVNERPANGDTSYVADGTVNDIKSFALDDLVAGTTGVTAVFPTVCFEKDDATTRAIAIGQRTSSTNAFGANIGAPGTYAYFQQVMTTDGAGAALTPSGVNATELLVKVAV